MKSKKSKLKLKKEVLGNLLDEAKMDQIVGGAAFLSLFGSNCYNTNPSKHNCCLDTRSPCTIKPSYKHRSCIDESPVSVNAGSVVYNGVQVTQTINTPNPNLDGTGTITSLLTGDATYGFGTQITQVIIKAPQAVSEGMIRLFVAGTGSGGGWFLVAEVPVQPTSQTGSSEAFQQIVPFDGLQLAPNAELGVSTETGDTFVVTAYGLDITGYV